MIEIENLIGFFYLLSNYFLTRQIVKKYPKLKTLFVYVTLLYIQVLFLSAIFQLNIIAFGSITLLIFLYIFLIKENSIYQYFDSIKKNLNPLNILIILIYSIYGFFVSNSKFNFDDVLTTYIPRVDLWIKYQSIFIDAELEQYYNPILIYPPIGQFNLLLIEFFKFSPAINLLFSLFIIGSIFNLLNNFVELNQKESFLLKISIFLSPIIIILSTSGLSDLLYYYFFILSLISIFNYFELNESFYLAFAVTSSVIATSVRFHGVVLIFLIGLLLIYKSLNIRTVYIAAKSFIVSFIAFLGPFIIFLISRNKLELFLGSFNSQLNQNIEVKFGDNEYLQIFLFENQTFLKYFLNIYNSVSHTVINFLFSDFPFILFIPELSTSQNFPRSLDFLFRFQIFNQAVDVRTPGTFIFIFASIFLIFSYFKIIKAFIQENKVSFSNLGKSHEIVVLIVYSFTLYFLIISLRDFSSANFRYLTPIFLIILPLSIKFLNISKLKNLYKFSIIFIFLMSLQPLMVSEMLWAKPYPDFVFENEIDSSIRGWHSSNLEANINEIVLDTDMIAVEKNNPAIVFSLKSKFPIGILTNNKSAYIKHDQFEYVSKEFFEIFGTNILMTDKESLRFDTENILLVRGLSSPKREDVPCSNPYLEYYPQMAFSSKYDKFGYQQNDYKDGIRIYRFDAPITGHEVFSPEDLEQACTSGYVLTPYSGCEMADLRREKSLTINGGDEFGFTAENYREGVRLFIKDGPEIGDEVFNNSDLRRLCSLGYSLEKIQENIDDSIKEFEEFNVPKRINQELINTYDYFIIFVDY